MPQVIIVALIIDAVKLEAAVLQRLQMLSRGLDPNRFDLHLYFPEAVRMAIAAAVGGMGQARCLAAAPGSRQWRRELGAALAADGIEVAHVIAGAVTLPAVPRLMSAQQLPTTAVAGVAATRWRRLWTRRTAMQRFVVTTAAAKDAWVQYGLPPQQIWVIHDAIGAVNDSIARDDLCRRLKVDHSQELLVGFADSADAGISVEAFAQQCPHSWLVLPLRTLAAARVTPEHALAALDLLVCPQPSSAIPLILQAMAAACPVVSLDEIGGDDRAGMLLVSPSRPDLLAPAARQVLQQRRLRRWLQVSGRQRAQWFSPQRMANGYEQLYTGLAADRS